MALDSEAIWAALFERLRAAAGFRTYSRRRPTGDYGLEQYPVLLLLDDNGTEEPTTDADAPAPAWKMTGEVLVITRPPDTDKTPTAQLNALVKTVREQLERAATDPLGTGNFYGRGYVQHDTNLGGLVRVLRVTRVEKAAGEVQGEAVATFTIEMEAQ